MLADTSLSVAGSVAVTSTLVSKRLASISRLSLARVTNAFAAERPDNLLVRSATGSTRKHVGNCVSF